MFRLARSLLVGLLLSGCVSAEALKEAHAQGQARLKAQIEAAKIPEVRLSVQQLAKLKEFARNHEIAWYRAGRQSDGKTFVCYVTAGKTLFNSTHIGLITGTFEPDGSFQRTSAHLWGPVTVKNDCRKRGFDPPVTITGGNGF